MATTALKIPRDGNEERMLFMTVQREDNLLDVDIFLADENFIPYGTTSTGYSKISSEEEYHTNLRKDAASKGHFVPDHSTNSEWNPNQDNPS